MDLRTTSRLFFIAALLAGAWFLVRMLKPREADLQAINSRDGQLGDMTPAAVRRTEGAVTPDDVSSLDMMPTSSLPLAGPGSQEPATEPVGVPLNAIPPPAPSEPEPTPAPAPPAKPMKKPRVHPQFQPQENPLGKSAATSSAFLAAPDETKKKDPKKPK